MEADADVIGVAQQLRLCSAHVACPPLTVFFIPPPPLTFHQKTKINEVLRAGIEPETLGCQNNFFTAAPRSTN